MLRHQSWKGPTAHYRPSLSATINAGATDSTTFSFRAKDRGAWGIMSMQFNSDKPLDELEVTCKTAGRIIVFSTIKANLLHKLFETRDLHAPIIIDENQPILFEIKNVGAANAVVTLTLAGFLQDALEPMQEYLRDLHGDAEGRIPHVFFAYVSTVALTAGQTGSKHELNDMGRSDLVFARLFVASGDEADLRITTEGNKQILLEDVYASQVDRMYKYQDEQNPFIIGTHRKFYVSFDNMDGANAQRACAMAETYFWK